MNKHNDLILPHGGYRTLRSFSVALAAARSGVQNIAEGSLASGTSKKTELKLTNVARASLEELIRDYEDFLRQSHLAMWDKNSKRVLAMRARLAGKLVKPKNSGPSEEPVKSEFFDEPLLSALCALKTASPEVSANIMLCIIHQASFLLGRQLQRLEKDFAEKGGFTERLYHYRQEHRGAGKVKEATPSDLSDLSDTSDSSDWSDNTEESPF